jgi:hypothetical protein
LRNELSEEGIPSKARQRRAFCFFADCFVAAQLTACHISLRPYFYGCSSAASENAARKREKAALRHEDGIAPSASSEHATRELPKKTVAKNFASLVT